ncbi:hypothetical protein GGH96_006364, partial [Coemansia sp. RSA 1972]
LTKADNAELRQPWTDLKQVLLNIKSLFIPPPGAPLVLRTDTARAGVGAVLLAQKLEDLQDLALLSYFSHVFGGQQGAKHLAWHELCAVYEVIKDFNPYLDSCVILRIETDCRTVESLFVHKTNNDADQLAPFKIALTLMGVNKYMLARHLGSKQITADWLSRANEQLRPSEYTKCQCTDDEIPVWIARCMQCSEHVGELMPDYNIVKKKRLCDGILYES